MNSDSPEPDQPTQDDSPTTGKQVPLTCLLTHYCRVREVEHTQANVELVSHKFQGDPHEVLYLMALKDIDLFSEVRTLFLRNKPVLPFGWSYLVRTVSPTIVFHDMTRTAILGELGCLDLRLHTGGRVFPNRPTITKDTVIAKVDILPDLRVILVDDDHADKYKGQVVTVDTQYQDTDHV